ncbi:MAG: hypothetical protein ACREN8_01450 [Candidatus Dormibacteraceae bacterium]
MAARAINRRVRTFLNSAPAEAPHKEVKLIAVEYPVHDHRFAAVAWGWRMFMDTWDPRQPERFYATHVDHGPENSP